MAEERKGTPIEKWDEVNGRQMRSIEDAIEQNDNSLDGVINNLPQPDEAEKTRESVLQKLKEHEKKAEEGRERMIRNPCPAREREPDV